MFKIEPDIKNEIYPSLYDISTNPNSNYYLLIFTNLQTRRNEGKVVTKEAINNRYVKLTFNVNTGVEPKFTMQETSFFKYDIYEQTSSTNTDIDDVSVLGLRETGKAYVGGTSEVSYIKQPEANNTNKVYLKT